MAVLVNGQPDGTLDPLDRGLHYGDGLFETLAVRDGSARFLDWHLERLAGGAARLGLPMPEPVLWQQDVAEAWPAGQGVVKLLLTRGAGGRGYRPPPAPKATRIALGSPWPERSADFWQRGVRVRLCATRLGHNLALAGLKHLNRLEQVLARAEWDEADFEEGLMLDEDGQVVCGTQSNLFAVAGGRLLTPPLQHCGVAGVMRRALTGWASARGIPVAEQPLRPADLLTADGLLLTKALVGAWPARELEGRELRVPSLAREFNDWLEGQW